jgi:hypothetical protein
MEFEDSTTGTQKVNTTVCRGSGRPKSNKITIDISEGIKELD